jgi:hypothetical protein
VTNPQNTTLLLRSALLPRSVFLLKSNLFLPPLPLASLLQLIGEPLLQEVINLIKVYLDKEKKFRRELYNILRAKL